MDHIKINKHHWNQKVAVHINSDFYDQEGFMAGKNSNDKIVMDLLGDVSGKSILHLQCHFGQDTLSLARLGAEVCGVDFADEAIEQARILASQMGLNAEFICCNVFDTKKYLKREFDIVFASYGVIGWHPDIQPWFELVAHFMKDNGQFVFAEFHPAVWMWSDDFSHVQYSYFNKQTISEEVTGTYADEHAPIRSKYVAWNHSLEEVLNNMIRSGMTITSFQEYDYSPYPCFQNVVAADRGYHIRNMEGKLPLVFSVTGSKSAT